MAISQSLLKPKFMKKSANIEKDLVSLNELANKRQEGDRCAASVYFWHLPYLRSVNIMCQSDSQSIIWLVILFIFFFQFLFLSLNILYKPGIFAWISLWTCVSTSEGTGRGGLGVGMVKTGVGGYRVKVFFKIGKLLYSVDLYKLTPIRSNTYRFT